MEGSVRGARMRWLPAASPHVNLCTSLAPPYAAWYIVTCFSLYNAIEVS
jgi:hypothetical protein